MERPYSSIEFEAEVDENGYLRIPRQISQMLKSRGRVTVRLTNGSIPASLRRRRVTEEEIESIAVLQLEQRENVVRFLLSEGSLASNRSFKKRAAALLKRNR